MDWLKKILPQSIKQSFIRNKYYSYLFFIDLFKNYLYDFKRFWQYSATNGLYSSQLRHQGRMIAHYHQIEKGLSLKNPRVGFGKEVIRHLVSMLKLYQEKYGWDEVSQVSLNVLFAYYKFNLENGVNDHELYRQISEIKEKIANYTENSTQHGGTLVVCEEDIKTYTSVDFRSFVNCRHSIRNFSDKEVDFKLIQDAVSVALKTPSVCNRQTWKVYVFGDQSEKEKILKWQTGNRGFGETASKILVVTSDLNYFVGAAERNQCFIDGGLFSMTLVYALHSLGLGTCCLNWSVTNERDKGLKKDGNIPQAESIIMLIAVGYLPKSLYVANSARRNLSEVLISR